MAGVAVFTLASLLSGLAWSERTLIVTRALQGLGGALLAPAALSIVATTFREGRERNIALGVWGAASGIGGAVGVLLGGVLTAIFLAADSAVLRVLGIHRSRAVVGAAAAALITIPIGPALSPAVQVAALAAIVAGGLGSDELRAAAAGFPPRLQPQRSSRAR